MCDLMYCIYILIFFALCFICLFMKRIKMIIISDIKSDTNGSVGLIFIDTCSFVLRCIDDNLILFKLILRAIIYILNR